MQIQTITASPTKLQSGAWGAKVQSETVQAGDTVTITTRAGKSWDATISKVLWTGDGVSICATESNGSSSSRPRRRGRSCACDDDCCASGCRCDSHCNCQGGPIYDC